MTAKLTNLNTMMILSTISGITEYLTTPKDSFSALLSGGGKEPETDLKGEMGKSAASGTNEGIQQIISLMKEESDKEQDVLISDNNISFKVKFFKDVEISFKK
jgi:hypothetical protein